MNNAITVGKSHSVTDLVSHHNEFIRRHGFRHPTLQAATGKIFQDRDKQAFVAAYSPHIDDVAVLDAGQNLAFVIAVEVANPLLQYHQ